MVATFPDKHPCSLHLIAPLQGSDGDTLGLHHAQDAPARGLPISHSAPSASLMLLERSGSNRRPLVHGHAHGSRSGLAASPRTVCLKLKATRPRPPAAARAAACAAVAAAVGEASPRPARQAARRSVAISAAAMDDDDYSYGSDTDTEPTPSGGASEERRSGGSAAGAGAGSAAASGSKKKHNPWSLTGTCGAPGKGGFGAAAPLLRAAAAAGDAGVPQPPCHSPPCVSPHSPPPAAPAAPSPPAETEALVEGVRLLGPSKVCCVCRAGWGLVQGGRCKGGGVHAAGTRPRCCARHTPTLPLLLLPRAKLTAPTPPPPPLSPPIPSRFRSGLRSRSWR